MPPKILCVEPYSAVLESRCAVLQVSGYDATSASPQLAEVVLRNQKFDLIVISSLNDRDVQRIVSFSDGAKVLVLEEFVMPAVALFGGTAVEPPAQSVANPQCGWLEIEATRGLSGASKLKPSVFRKA